MKHHITPPDAIRNAGWFKSFMDWIGTRVEEKHLAGRSRTDVRFQRGWEVASYIVWYDAESHR